MNKRIQALLASALILVILSCSGCGGGYSKRNYLIWRITQMPDGSQQTIFKGTADHRAIENLHARIVCFGAEYLSGDTAVQGDSTQSGGLIAVQFPTVQQASRMGAQPIYKSLFPPYIHFALASLLGRMRTCLDIGRTDKTVSDYSRVIEMNPQFAQAYYDRGVAYYRKGQYDLALSHYARAIELNPRLHKNDDMFVQLVRKKWARSKESQRS